ARCAPPDNKPLPQELANCSSFLDREFHGLKKVKVIVALGKIAFDAYLNFLKRQHPSFDKRGLTFAHGASYPVPDGKILLASYPPTNQNPQTGKLTRPIFSAIFKRAAELADIDLKAAATGLDRLSNPVAGTKDNRGRSGVASPPSNLG